MKKSIPPPENWQDFESLCKKLFGEVWGCPNTIKKNGRSGQIQAGVDIYAIPKGETEYWGIQCKGKDNYKKSKLTKNEINEEIEKALTFQPKLKVFAFATSALKDVEVEEYIRIKNLESFKAENFQILLYCWEDLVDLIEENRDTYNWYINKSQFKDKFDVDVKFLNNSQLQIIEPIFLKTTIKYQHKQKEETPPIFRPEDFKAINAAFQSIRQPILGYTDENLATCDFEIVIKNIGSIVLEDWKLILYFGEDVKDEQYGVYKKDPNKTGKKVVLKPKDNSPLIQSDYKTFYNEITPLHNAKNIKVEWELLARDFKRNGILEFEVNPQYKFKERIELIDINEEVREEETISDYIEKRPRTNF